MLRNFIWLMTFIMSGLIHQSIESSEISHHSQSQTNEDVQARVIENKLVGYAYLGPNIVPYAAVEGKNIFTISDSVVLTLDESVLAFNSEDGFFEFKSSGRYRIEFGGSGRGGIGLLLENFSFVSQIDLVRNMLRRNTFVFTEVFLPNPLVDRFTIQATENSSINFAFILVFFSEFPI